MKLLKPEHKSRGSILATALALMAVLVTIVIAMHTSQASAMRSVTQAEAELQFRQASEFATFRLLFGDENQPPHLKVSRRFSCR